MAACRRPIPPSASPRRRMRKCKERSEMSQHQGYAREHPGGQPPNDYSGYGSTVKRAPKRAPIRLDHTLTEITGPTFESGWAGADIADMTKDGKSDPIGERIVVAGRVLDEDGRPVPNTLLEIWQA